MPIFEYHCRRCGHPFETLLLIRQEKISCPRCESAAVEKRLSVFSARQSGNETTPPAVGCCARTPQTCGCH